MTDPSCSTTTTTYWIDSLFGGLRAAAPCTTT